MAEFNNKALSKLHVTVRQRLIGCQGTTFQFADGTQDDFTAVIWATGYRDDTSWLNVDGCTDDKGFVEHYGETPAEGLFVVGRKWLSCRASELVMGVERDVYQVLSKLESYLATSSGG